jgi:hypothetical protein
MGGLGDGAGCALDAVLVELLLLSRFCPADEALLAIADPLACCEAISPSKA